MYVYIHFFNIINLILMVYVCTYTLLINVIKMELKLSLIVSQLIAKTKNQMTTIYCMSYIIVI